MSIVRKKGTIISTVFAVVVAGGCYFLGGFGRLYFADMQAAGHIAENGTVLYEQLLGDPAAFQSYYMGMVEFLELRREAKEALGARFDETAFHETLLEGGDVPFSLLREKVAEYIAEHKN